MQPLRPRFAPGAERCGAADVVRDPYASKRRVSQECKACCRDRLPVSADFCGQSNFLETFQFGFG